MHGKGQAESWRRNRGLGRLISALAIGGALVGSMAAAAGPAAAQSAGTAAAGQSVTGITTRISGLPASITAGGSAAGFTVTVTNHTATAYRHVAVVVQPMQGDLQAGGRLQRYDQATGKWKAAAMPGNVISPVRTASGGSELAGRGTITLRFRLTLSAADDSGAAQLSATAVALPQFLQLGAVRTVSTRIVSGQRAAAAELAPQTAASDPDCSGTLYCAVKWAQSQVGSGPCGNGGAGYYATGGGQSTSCSGGGESHAWCADFAGWALQKAGATGLSVVNNEVVSFDNGLDSGGYGPLQTASSFVPEPGDLVLMGPYSGGELQHMAIVTASNGDTIGSGSSSLTWIGGNEGGGAGIVQQDTGMAGAIGAGTGSGESVYGYVIPVYKAANVGQAADQANICDNFANGYCLVDNAGSNTGGTPIVMEPEAQVPAQLINVQQDTSECGGTVTYTASSNTGCPFTDAAWDKAYAGDPIDNLVFGSIGSGLNCVGTDTTSDQDAILSSCAGAGSRADWVASAPSLVSVYWSNADKSGGKVQVLAGSDTDQAQATVNSWGSYDSQEWTAQQ
jgi:hypothetical protein